RRSELSSGPIQPTSAPASCQALVTASGNGLGGVGGGTGAARAEAATTRTARPTPLRVSIDMLFAPVTRPVTVPNGRQPAVLAALPRLLTSPGFCRTGVPSPTGG